MQKTLKVLAVLALFVAVLFVTNGVQAATVTELVNWGVATQEADGTYKLKETTGDIAQDIIIGNGENVVLDLNGQSLINYTAACEAIKVEQGGTLRIIDSKGGAKVTHKEDSTYSVLTNLGTLTIEGGTYTTSKSFYVIRNEGELLIDGAIITSTATDTSTVGNIGDTNPTITVKSGTLTSDYVLIINRDNCEVRIEGGTLTTKGENGYVVANKGGTLNIEGGTLTAENATNGAILAEAGTVEILPEATIAAPASSSIVNSPEGGTATVTTYYNITINQTTNGTVTVQNTQVAGNSEVVFTVTANTGYQVKSITVTDKDGNPVTVTDNKITMPESDVTVTVEFEEKEADYTKVDELIEYVNSLNPSDYTNWDGAGVDEAVNNVVRGLKASEQSTVDDYAKAIEEAISDLEKIPTYTVVIGETTFEVKEGKTLADLDLTSLKTKEGYEFVKFVKIGTDETFAEDTPITENLELAVIFEEIPKDAGITTNPDTSDALVPVIAVAVIAVVGLGAGVYGLKKNKKSN